MLHPLIVFLLPYLAIPFVFLAGMMFQRYLPALLWGGDPWQPGQLEASHQQKDEQ